MMMKYESTTLVLVNALLQVMHRKYSIREVGLNDDGGSTALWFEHWLGDCKVPGSMPSTISCCCLEQGTHCSSLPSYVNLQISSNDTARSSVTSPEGAVHGLERLPSKI